MAPMGEHINPLTLSLSKGERPRSWFDRLTTSGKQETVAAPLAAPYSLRLRQAAAGDLGVFGDGLDEHPAAAVLLGGESQGACAAEGVYEGFCPNSSKCSVRPK